MQERLEAFGRITRLKPREMVAGKSDGDQAPDEKRPTHVLRMHFPPQWFGLSDEQLEDAVCGSCTLREFLSVDRLKPDEPDATTVLKFRRCLETHGQTARIFEAANTHLSERGLLRREGAWIAATLVADFLAFVLPFVAHDAPNKVLAFFVARPDLQRQPAAHKFRPCLVGR